MEDSGIECCCMCGEPVFFGETMRLTDEEMAVIGEGAEREIHYCWGCLKVSQDLQQGANIIAGVFERRLRAAGVGGAEGVAAKFKENLLQAATRKLQ